MTTHTPLIQQYLDIKARHGDALLFFRVGDFYEMFFEDAEEGSRLLGLTLTARNNGGSADVPLAGVPAKAVTEYVTRLLRVGRRVAICEQIEDPSEAEGLVRREVVEILTPGTVLEDTLLAAARNNFIVAVAGEERLGLAAVDLSTGEFEVWECEEEALADELAKLEPAEILVSAERSDLPEGGWALTRREAWRFDPSVASERLRSRYEVRGVHGFGFQPESDLSLIAAAGALVAYLEEVRPAGLAHLRMPRVERRGRFMHLDEMTRRNLELVESLRPGGGTLLEELDRTRTAMGARLLRKWLLRPLLDRSEIEARQAAVGELLQDSERRRAVRHRLEAIRDLERLGAKVSAGRASPRELRALGESLGGLPGLVDTMAGCGSARLERFTGELDLLEDVEAEIVRALSPEAPPTLRDGGVIRPGYSDALDDLRTARESAVEWIAGLQVRERERTGIDSLKIGYNKVFGYYLEVTRAKSDRVPEDYIRKQTLTNAERYLTPELKEWEARVVGAEEKIAELEARLFRELRERVAGEVSRIQETAARVAEVDVLASLAEVAQRNDYARPALTEDQTLEIRAGRHPVVERMVARERFIPNDVALDSDLRVMVLTGPNMAGKSTFLRQVGHIVLMAQIGSFVPARSARIGLCDRIFTRVGASDNLAAGMSTFMVEMTETAVILNTASRRSLVLLDEIGRGTSTYDGVSIAWAVTEHLQALGARTIFATHYHELVELAELLEGVGAFNVAVRESGEDIVFLHRVEPGGSDRSYGVHVGRLAGLPPEVVTRAGEVLHELENGPRGTGSRVSRLVDLGRRQLSLFEPAAPSPVLERLEELDPDRMTPLQALNALSQLKGLMDSGEQA
ncbi:MAG: DNA mismatch repair protein MutS [Gemmatimonadota bacterium]